MNNTEPQVLEPLPNQPRQPTNLQGLLRFAMEATNSQNVTNDTPFQSMDEEVGSINIFTLTLLYFNYLYNFYKKFIKDILKILLIETRIFETNSFLIVM